MKKIIAFGFTLALLTGCGTYQLGYVAAQNGQTKDQQQLDILTCKDQATLAANSSERVAGAFLLGLTIVGAPLAHELEKSKARSVYSECMSKRGYQYSPPA